MRDRSTLPKWAQQEMERLERERDSWKEKVFYAAAEKGFTDTSLRYRPEPDRGLPIGSTVVFKTITGEIEARMKDAKLEVRALSGLVVIEPYTSNVVCISSRLHGG
jgi:hypothetical protein